ncbi:MAG: exodeoxyribonuclease VII large subunit [Neomegalonema sp.]|nr:exodeoxyribonuclease VII large subunit [Neomegalonema sp.]
MSDLLLDDDEPGDNQPEASVSELSARIKRMVEDAFGHVRVRGEIGRVSRPRSGHIYLDLKDDKAVISGVIWAGVAKGLRIQPEEGMEVIAEGRITTFPGQSKYQIVIERLAPAGVGALMMMLEERKKKLAGEGLFAPERKRALPYLPEVIGVITSPSGAVIRDILHRLSDRFPRHVLLWPVAVQGEKCAGEVARAIAGFNALEKGGAIERPDVLIVARGGGSLEDLWGFNEEIVARAAAASAIPLISAVGHETDTTLIDYVADRRAPTPTAAAEMAVPVRGELLAQLSGLEERRQRGLWRLMEDRRARLRDLARALPRAEDLVALPRQRLDSAADRLPRALLAFARGQELRLSRIGGRLSPGLLSRKIERGGERAALFGDRLAPALARSTALRRDRFDRGRFAERLSRAASTQTRERAERLEKLGRLLHGFSYKATLARGYAAVRSEGAVIGSAEAAGAAALLSIEFADGAIQALPASDGAPPEADKPARPRKVRRSATKDPQAPKDDQGSLF